MSRGYLDTPIIYNLFPRLAGTLDRWPKHAERALAMGFNWVFINPINYPGFSGSLYATKDYYRLNPVFLSGASELSQLDAISDTIRTIAAMGLHPIVDLVINHTSKDSPLVQEHPCWYLRDHEGDVESPYAVDPDDPGKRTVWGDLAEIDNWNSQDRDALWSYWTQLVEEYLELGFDGFRCDAAYKVPSELWSHLLGRARDIRPDVRFFAETLGCTLEQTRALRASGLHFFFNSSKWWDFEAPWCLEQHREFQDIPSISFPESHDTERLSAETDGNEAVQRLRYAFAAVFSAGVMMPIGYEYGFKKKLNVVTTSPEDWEQPSFDLTPFIARVNSLKTGVSVLQGNGSLYMLPLTSGHVIALERRSQRDPSEGSWVIINKNREGQGVFHTSTLIVPGGFDRMLRLCKDDMPPDGETVPDQITLDPSELVLITSKVL